MPAYTAASSILTFPLEALRTSLASVSHFQTWLGITSGTTAERIAAAKLRIFLEGFPLPEGNDESYSEQQQRSQLFPCCLLWLDQFDNPTDANGEGWEYGHDSGRIHAEFHALIDSERQPGEVNRQFLNQIGLVLQSQDNAAPGLCELSGTGGHFTFNRFTTSGVYRSEPDESAQHNPAGDAPLCVIPVDFHWGAAFA